jgi:SAM-dependent methyltransferase
MTNGLTRRKSVESTWHDEWVTERSREAYFYDTPFASTLLADLESYAISQFGDLSDKRILYYGCGVNIKPALRLAKQGAIVVMIDISSRSVKLVADRINQLDYGNRIVAFVCDCENLPFRDNEFHGIYGRAILHHLELTKSLGEIRRVLRPNGLSVFIEPLGINPVVNLYRRMTPHRRTPDEKPLDLNSIRNVADIGFTDFRHEEFTLLPMLGIFSQSFLHMSANPIFSYKTFKDLDNLFLRLFPSLRNLCWNTVLVMIK